MARVAVNDRRAMLATSTPISNSDANARPNGTLVMGFFITSEWQKRLENRLLQQLQIEDNPSALGNAFVLDITASRLSTNSDAHSQNDSSSH
jgi:hypothetical protein